MLATEATVQLPKRLEEDGKVLRLNADSRVDHTDSNLLLRRRSGRHRLALADGDRNPDRSPVGKLNCIVQQVDQYLLESALITDNRRQFWRQTDAQVDSFLLRQ